MRLFFLLVCVLSSYGLRGQSITGVVYSDDGPLIGASVQWNDPTGTITDTEGRFVIDNLAQGTYTLTIRSIGHTTVTRKVTTPANDISIYLPMNSLGLQEVVITGSMAPVYLKDSPVKIEVVTSKHINTFLPSASTGIIESISLINGVQEVVACGVCFTNSISINGLPGPYTAVLLDGTPMYGNLASVYGLNGIPASMIDRVEVIKGPNSTLYGSEAVAGVINVITKDPAEQPKVSLDVMGTSHREVFSNLAYRMDVGNSRGQIAINHAYVNIFEDENSDGFSDIVNLDRLSLFSKWDIARPSGKKWNIAAKYYYEDRRNGVEQFLKDRAYLDIRGSDSIYGESIFTERIELFGSYETSFIPNFRIDYSFSTHNQDSYYGADGYLAKQKIAFANFIWSPTITDHKFLSGLTMRYQDYDDNTIATPTTDKQFIPGIFLQDEWTISRHFSVLAGTRLDHYDRHGLIFSPRLNLKAKAGALTTFRANFGTGFRLVNLFTEDHAFITGQREVVIEEELKPERSINGSLNINQLVILGESQGSLDLDMYYTLFTNKIIPDYSDPAFIRYGNSEGNAVTKGIGVTWSHEFAFPLSFSAGMTYQQTTEQVPASDGSLTDRDVEFAPEFSGTFTVNYTWKKTGVQFAYSAQLTGPMQLPEVYDLDDQGVPLSQPRPLTSGTFSIHSIQLTRNIGQSVSLYGGVQNIFNYVQEYSPLSGYNDPAFAPGFSDNFDTAYSFAPIHGREIYLGLKWQLHK